MSRPGLGRNHSIGPLSEITPSHTPGTWTPKSIATRSFENLVAFAKDQELRREAKKLVWRDKGENPAELTTIEECFNHAWTGGKREYQCHKTPLGKLTTEARNTGAGTLAFGIRAGLKFTLIRHAIFGSDSFRFAAMMGTFVAVYKFFINALPLIPNNKLPEILRYTPPAAQSEFDPHSSEEPLYMKRREEKRPEVEVADKKPPSRDVFSVRVRIPFGDVMVFSLCCGQIMYAFLLSPTTIPRSYRVWIQRASKVPTACVRMNHDLTRTGKFNIEDIKELISWEKTTPANKDRLMARLEAATKGHFGPHFAPCGIFLDGSDIWCITFYTNDSIQTKRVHETTVKDVETERIWNRQEFSIPWSVCGNLSKASWWLGGFLSGLSLLVEDKRRRGELAMYVLPRGLESAWGVMRRRGWVPIVPGGENLLCAMGMGMVMATYQTSPQHLSGMVRRIMYQFIGPN
ncbi:peroxisome organization [Rhizoctonia solani]|uniref:Peroxisome organization n=1 Tax=Rhizoctonia solani TaxID=456999 RepID=A0A8H7IL12_9AGAM|nr:peroxisome organization [Rhizoctonia solani]